MSRRVLSDRAASRLGAWLAIILELAGAAAIVAAIAVISLCLAPT